MLSRSFFRVTGFFLVLIFSISIVSGKGYEIKVKITGVSDTSIILGHYLNESMFPDDTTQVNQKGVGIFKGEKPLAQGMYIIYLPSGRFFQLMMGEDQEFTITTDTANFVENATIEGSIENEIFFDFQQYMFSKQKEIGQLQEKLKQAENDAEKKEIRQQISDLSSERIDKIKSIKTEHPDLFVSTFLTATLDIEVPDPPKDETGKVDSTWQYRYYRHHFFDNFDPTDGRLLRTPLYEEKVMYYLEKVIPQIPDTIIAEVDYLLDGALSDSTLFRYLLVTLFNHYGKSNIMGMDAVQVHLAEKYYLKVAWWSEQKFIEELEDRVSTLKPLLLGNKAPNVELVEVPTDHFKAAMQDTAVKSYPHAGQLRDLYSIGGEYIVLFFWEATCSHCKKAVPEMYRIYKEELEPKGITVVSVSTLFGVEGKEKWIDFVNKNGTYDWINAWNPYDYKFKVVYDIRSTPQIFILNKDKEIIAKRLGPEQVAGLIEMYDKEYSK